MIVVMVSVLEHMIKFARFECHNLLMHEWPRSFLLHHSQLQVKIILESFGSTFVTRLLCALSHILFNFLLQQYHGVLDSKMQQWLRKDHSKILVTDTVLPLKFSKCCHLLMYEHIQLDAELLSFFFTLAHLSLVG